MDFRANQKRAGRQRLLLIDDVTRCPANGLERHPQNLKTLRALVSASTRPPFGIADVDVQTVGEDEDVRVSPTEVLIRSGLEPGMKGWCRFLQLADAPPALVEYFRNLLGEAHLIIGFELPKPMFLALESAGFSVVDVAIGPLRFLPELNFDVCCSFDLYPRLAQWRVKDEDIFSASATYSGMAYRERPELNQWGRIGVLLGQTKVDAALVHQDGMFDPIAEPALLLEWAESVDTVVYKPHPFHYDFTMADILEQLGHRVVCTEFPTYQLLSFEEVKTVMAISSGTLLEAEYFGAEAKPMMTPPRWKERDHHLLAVSSDMLSPFGLSQLLRREPSDDLLVKGPNLRRVFGHWGDQDLRVRLDTYSIREAKASRKNHRRSRKRIRQVANFSLLILVVVAAILLCQKIS